MDHMRLSDELRQMLMENAAWSKVGVEPKMIEEAAEEAPEVEETEEVEEVEETEEEEVVEEAAEVHVCPLCVSQLEGPLDEEALLEHLHSVMTLVDRLTQINEGEEDIEEVIHNTVADLLFGEDEE